MEYTFLQSSGIRLCVFVDYTSLGADTSYDSIFLQGRQDSGIFADTVSFMGELCGVSELYDMDDEQINAEFGIRNAELRGNLTKKQLDCPPNGQKEEININKRPARLKSLQV